MNNIADLFKKYREQIMYLVVGGLTTVFCIGIKFLLEKVFGIVGLVSVLIAEPLAMVFAYITNKIWVFKSKCKDIKDLMREMISFFSARIFTIILSAVISLIFVDMLKWPNMPVQIAAAIIVVILNYVFSKLFIFKGNK